MNFSETIFLFVLALIVFGPKKLPEIARQIGKWMNEFRRASNEFKSQIEQEIAHMEVEKQQTILPPSTPPEGTASRALYQPEASVSESSPTDAAAVDVPAPDPAATLAASTDDPESPARNSEGNSNGHAPGAPEAIGSPDGSASSDSGESPSVNSTTSQEFHA